ncbi:hypothetical protein L2E82_29927 [Cichorium intybus]|uniref:Uncharacterized protein n=1 Tax=Cichorium intybus TaxID=13427 RepID=A0ACB9CZA6_CICIN|nr:hypothetical protein L2E82_29927 [Cichorium intybus]
MAPKRRVLRPQTAELIPSSLYEFAPILRVANAVEKSNRRVAYLCRWYAFEIARTLDSTLSVQRVLYSTSSVQRVQAILSELIQCFKREDKAILGEQRKSDVHEMEIFYKMFNKDSIHAFQNADKANEEDRINCKQGHQIAVVLFEVLNAVSRAHSVEVPDEIKKAHAKLVEIAEIYHYDLLPVDPDILNESDYLDVSSSNHVYRNVLPLEPESSCQAEKQANDLKMASARRRVVRPQTAELIPSSLFEFAPILRVANAVEKSN